MAPIKVKVFSENSTHINPQNEIQLNEWLQANPNIEILHLLQSESMVLDRENDIARSMTISVFYRQTG